MMSMWAGLGAGLGAAKEEAGHGRCAEWELTGKGLEDNLMCVQHQAPPSALS